jgi:hypothetical protein
LKISLDELVVRCPFVLALGVDEFHDSGTATPAIITHPVDLANLATLLARIWPQLYQP